MNKFNPELVTKILYPATVIQENGDDGVGFTVLFRDIPEAITQWNTWEDAIEMGEDALSTAFEFYFEDGREIPAPSEYMSGDVLVAVSEEDKVKLIENRNRYSKNNGSTSEVGHDN